MAISKIKITVLIGVISLIGGTGFCQGNDLSKNKNSEKQSKLVCEDIFKKPVLKRRIEHIRMVRKEVLLKDLIGSKCIIFSYRINLDLIGNADINKLMNKKIAVMHNTKKNTVDLVPFKGSLSAFEKIMEECGQNDKNKIATIYSMIKYNANELHKISVNQFQLQNIV